MLELEKLKNEKIWLLYKKVIKDDGGTTKVPYSIKNIKIGTTKEYYSELVDYNTALYYVDIIKADGVGFVIKDGYAFIDIDNKNYDDVIVKRIVDSFDSYAEKSQSGNGIHIYVKCDKTKVPTNKSGNKVSDKYYVKNDKKGYEIYIGGLTDRFAAFTGNAINDKDINESTNSVLSFLDEEMLRDEDSIMFEPQYIIDKLSTQKNSAKFKKLFYDGDLSLNNNNHSEADLALCTIISFRTGNNPNLIDKIFRMSKLYREKWERKDYRENTIKKSIEIHKNVFHSSLNKHYYFIKFNKHKNRNEVIPQLLSKYIKEHEHYKIIKGINDEKARIYIYYDNKYTYFTDDMFEGLVKEKISEFDPMLVDFKVTKHVLNDFTKSIDVSPFECLDSNENIIDFNNCILKIDNKGFEVMNHTPEILSTIRLNVDWDGNYVETPYFDKFLNDMFDGHNDKEELKHLLYTLIGLTISNVKFHRIKKTVFFVGKGNTGKSKIMELMEYILGKNNYMSIDLDELEARFGTSNIVGKRLVGSADMSYMNIKQLKVLKKITGSDSLFCEKKGKDGFSFKYNGAMWFCMNKLPKFSATGGDNGEHVYERMIIIDCKNQIASDKQDKKLIEKLKSEAQGIVYKSIMALIELVKNNYELNEPETIINNRKKYMNTNNPINLFFNECMTKRDNAVIFDNVYTGNVFRAYVNWCKLNNNGYSSSQNDFREQVANIIGMPYNETIKRNNKSTYYIDYTLTEDAREEYM